VLRSLLRIVALCLAAWLPIQAAALPAFVLACDLAHGDENGAPAAQAVQHAHAGQHDADGNHESAGHDGTSPAGYAGHACCHLTISTAPVASLAIAPRPAGFEAPVLVARVYGFIPDQPKRPPLTAL
jgi:hypothetical protein